MFKDCDLIMTRDKLAVGSQARRELISILQRDSDFLSDLNLMDYSLFVAEVPKSHLSLRPSAEESLLAKLIRAACGVCHSAGKRLFSKSEDRRYSSIDDSSGSRDDGVSLLLNHDSVVYEDRCVFNTYI